MPRDISQQPKLLRLQQIFLEETDEDHALSVEDLIHRLQQMGIRAERKSIYENIETLTFCGLDIVKRREGAKNVYFVGQRDFEEAEVRLLADAVASSRFITLQKSRRLLEKLTTLTSRHQGAELKRQLYVASRIKNMNDTIYTVLDRLNQAILNNVAIQFCYYDWKLEKGRLVKAARHNGSLYTISPWQLLWQDELYYLIAYDHNARQLRHYRIDRMGMITITREKRQGKEEFDQIRMEDYTSSLFGMFGGQTQRVTLEFDPRMLDVMVDRFGKSLRSTLLENGRISITVDVVPSLPFYGWLFSLGEDVRLVAPTHLVAQYKESLNRQLSAYEQAKKVT